MSITTRSDYLQPALIGGVASGVLSALPIVSAGNICCCLWVVCGGLLASYFLQQNRLSRIELSDGAIVGLLAGVVGAFVQLVLSIPIGLLVGPIERQLVQRLTELSGRVPPEGPGMLGGAAGVIGVVVFSAILFLFMVTVGSVFSAVGGALGAALFAKDPQPGGTSSGL